MGLYAVAATQLVFRLFHPIDRSNLDTFLQKRNSKERERGTINHDSVPRLRFGLPKTNARRKNATPKLTLRVTKIHRLACALATAALARCVDSPCILLNTLDFARLANAHFYATPTFCGTVTFYACLCG